jgi:acyl-CoA oxidase
LGALSGGRVAIAYSLTTILTNSITIAIRYVLSRRQFSAPKSHDEVLLFDYPITKYRLMPLLASTVVYTLGGQECAFEWDSNLERLLDPHNNIIAELHAVSSALKPIVSWFCIQMIQICRQMLGGHGYSQYSRYGTMFNDADINQTWEGDNNVLLQQTAKYILDHARKSMKGTTFQSKTLRFLNNVNRV